MTEMEKAFFAIRARVNGEFDSPALMAFGELHSDPLQDVRRIVASVNVFENWSGSPDPDDPDNFWIDDITGERVNAHTGERIAR